MFHSCRDAEQAGGWRVEALTCVYPQVDLQVMGGAEGLAAVRAVLGGRGQGALSMLGQRRLDAPRCLHQVLANIWSTHTHTHEEDKWKAC